MRWIRFVFLLPYYAWVIVLFLLFLISSTLVAVPVANLLSKKMGHSIMMLIYKCWSWLFCSLSFIRIKRVNPEHFTKNQPSVIIANHCSNLDMFLGAIGCPLKTKPLGKIELKKIPLLGYLFSTSSVLIDRKSRESREQGIKKMVVELKAGYHLFLYPEGTRNRTKKPLQDFYDGAFRLAIDTQVPLQAFVSVNARKLVPGERLDIRPGTIRLFFLPPYPTKGLTQNDLPDLKMKIHADMESILRQHDCLYQGH